MLGSVPAVLIASDNGKIHSQNRPARQLLGNKHGVNCWEVFSRLKNTENLPCQKNCVSNLLGLGFNRALRNDINIEGKQHRLCCVPFDGNVICTLNDQSSDQPKPWQNVTPRELDVLKLLAEGKTNGAIAGFLEISESTVRTHVEKMLIKLGAKNRAALVASGFRLGYIS
ncbi:MAG: DNA-binding CsgD family transcriptional regulator [Halioglobus sp.]|jgi:DNA-binding CsgD family transcriptional regulator